jgi:hypothetical protein
MDSSMPRRKSDAFAAVYCALESRSPGKLGLGPDSHTSLKCGVSG